MSKKVFSADVAQLLKLVTHSIYSNKEIFIRELIANANDAIQKAKILAAGDANYLGDEVDLNIKITLDKDSKTLTIQDSGIGMTMEDVENHIGTIAKSGTKSFLEKIKDRTDTPNNLVGQFGIGFYSAFMVADSVEIFTKSPDSKTGVHRSSTGDAQYEISKNEKSDRGTTIILHLNDESTEYLEDYRIRSLIRKYADYIPVPILMKAPLTPRAGGDNKENTNKEATQGKDSLPEGGAGGEGFAQVNSMTAIRQKSKKDVTAEEYTKHFQSLAFSTDAPLDTIHINVEGNINYKAVLYIPSKPNPFVDLNDPAKEYGPALYVQNVMIMEHAKDLLPAWMRHIVGVVETPDLPLNVSRELLQQSSIMSKIQSSLVKEVIKSLIYIKKESESVLPDKGGAEGGGFLQYFQNFGRLLKEGVYYDNEKREEIASLLYFSHSSATKEESPIPLDKGGIEGDLCTLDQYITTNTPHLSGLKSIYYLHTPSAKEGAANPHLHKASKRNLDVLFMTDPIDEYMLSVLRTYKEYEFVNLASSDAKMPELAGESDTKKEVEKTEKKHKNFLVFVSNTIGNDKLEKVSFGHDLGDSLAVINTPDGQPTAQMMRMVKAMGQEVPTVKKTLIINSENDLVKKYLDLYESDPKADKMSDFVTHLYEQALLLEGSEVDSLSAFLKRANELMS